MKVAAFILIASLTTALAAQTSQPAWTELEGGQLILRPFASAPFPHKSRENGYKNFPREPHYTDATVGIFIPRDYKPGEVVNYVVYFHGHKNTVAHALEQYRLPQQLAAAKVNAILLVPQGPKNASDDSAGKLEEPGGFSRLINEVTRYLRSEKKIRANTVGQIVLSAHSGGYWAASCILYNGGMGREISDVLLLDAAYGGLAPFANFTHNNHDIRLVSLYTDHLAKRNQELMQLLTGLNMQYRELDEATLKDADLLERMSFFVHTKGPHDQIPVDYFGRLLRTSALAPKARD
jgi:hypothetical protein